MLLNVLNEYGDRSRSHGIPPEVLKAQAECLDQPIEFIESSWKDYEVNFIKKLKGLKQTYACTHAVYGDIDIESHRAWEEKVSEAAGLEPLLPIWQGDRLELVKQMLDAGIKAMIVSCQKPLAEHLLGSVISPDLLGVFDELGIDACGENGEYHTLVIDGPMHQRPLQVLAGGRHEHGNYSFLELSLAK